MVPLRTFPIVASTLLLLIALGGVWISLAGAAAPRNPVPFADVAGSYYRGDGLGINQSLDITAYGSFKFHFSSCLRSSQTPGRVLRHGSLIFLGPIGPRGWDIDASGFLPVHWGDRRYLVPAGDVMSFVNEVNLGSEPRTKAQGMHYLQGEDWKLPASGRPLLPESYARHLLEEPVEGVVYRILGEEDEDLTFDVAAGPATGLLAPGMALVAHGSKDDSTSYCELKVVSVATATAVVERSWETDCYELRAGDPVSTSLASLSSEPFRKPGRRVLG
jgi:hypothetical protein